MTNDNKEANIKVELRHGDESLKAAELCLNAALYNDAVSRAYYAAYHYIQALLFSEGLEAKSHKGTQHLLNEHFVRSNRFSKHLFKKFVGLHSYREQADYARAYDFDAAGAAEEFDNAKAIETAVKQTLNT